MRGFFAGSQNAQSVAPLATVAQCGACGLSRRCTNPKMPYGGGGARGILIVGPAPTADDDRTGMHFRGPDGDYLRNVLRKCGVVLERDCWYTNALICAPGTTKVTADHVGYCQPNLHATIKELQPEIIIPLGIEAIRAVVGRAWAEDVGELDRWVRWRIPSRSLNAWVCPTWPPGAIAKLQNPDRRKVFDIWFERHIEEAVSLSGRPWAEVPDHTKDVRCITDIAEAARLIRKITADGGPCAWDYEANMLKPEGDAARLVSCSICWRGRRTIAYPWHGEAITATQEFLRSPCPKIASNLKFEERWTYKEFGHRVRNWLWDTMINAHLIDNRKGTKSIKFQSFVHLGVPVYNKHIEPFLKSKDPRQVNQILKQIDMKDLLLYNGLDSLFEYQVAMKQMEILGYPLP